MKYFNFDKTDAYKKLSKHAMKAFLFREKLDAKRVGECLVPMAAGLQYSWAAKPVGDKCIKLLQDLADEQDLIAKYKTLLNGEVMNTGENRKCFIICYADSRGSPLLKTEKISGNFTAKNLQDSAISRPPCMAANIKVPQARILPRWCK